MSGDELHAKWEHLARSPVAWLDTAMTLRECAEIIGRLFVGDLRRRLPPGGSETTEGVQPISFGPIFQMLAGYTLEALLKGIIVARNRNVIRGKYLTKDFLSHDFDELLSLAGITFDERRLEFLRRLGTAVLWVGRYPVSRGADTMQKGKYSSSGDLPLFADVYSRLVEALQAELRRQQSE
jgi:hypothetical protein